MTEARKGRRWSTILMWVCLLLALASTGIWRLTHRNDDEAQVSWTCGPKAPRGIVCRFEAVADSDGVCFDVVLDCSDGAHRAEVCSGSLRAGKTHDVSAPEATPPLGAAPSCRPPRYENRRAL